MPLPLVAAAPLIGGAVSGLGSFFGSLFGANKQDKINQQQLDFAREMYDRQLRDNHNQWTLQNDYNSPQSQMQRLRDAGLNPNLVYGNGSAVHTAGPIKGADTPQWNPKSVSPDIGGAIQGGLQSYFDISQRSAQTDNLKAQNTVLLQEAALKAAQTGSTIANAAKSEFDLKRGEMLLQTSADYAKMQLQNAGVDWELKNQQFQRNRQLTPLDVKGAELRNQNMAATYQNIIQNTKNAKLQGEFKQLENELRKNGITSSDPFYFRVIGQLLSKFGITIK